MIDKPRFRSAWLGTWPLSLLDAVLHALVAWLLPGTWWFQYLPDAVLPVLWTRSFITNRMAADDDWLLQVHRALHVRPPSVAVGILLWIGAAAWLSPWLALHVAVHAGIDRLTHDGRWQ